MAISTNYANLAKDLTEEVFSLIDTLDHPAIRGTCTAWKEVSDSSFVVNESLYFSRIKVSVGKTARQVKEQASGLFTSQKISGMPEFKCSQRIQEYRKKTSSHEFRLLREVSDAEMILKKNPKIYSQGGYHSVIEGFKEADSRKLHSISRKIRYERGIAHEDILQADNRYRAPMNSKGLGHDRYTHYNPPMITYGMQASYNR